tara:strand:+ start:334 stop:762 length:429 start_codon:yes stop_codon:yes gene_type:complete
MSMARKAFNFGKSLLGFPYDLFLQGTGTSTGSAAVGAVAKHLSKSFLAGSEDRKQRNQIKMNLAQTFIKQSPKTTPNLPSNSRFQFSDPRLTTQITRIVNNTNNTHLREILSRYQSTPRRTSGGGETIKLTSNKFSTNVGAS